MTADGATLLKIVKSHAVLKLKNFLKWLTNTKNVSTHNMTEEVQSYLHNIPTRSKLATLSRKNISKVSENSLVFSKKLKQNKQKI